MLALIIGVGVSRGLFPALAVHVSQKHVVETYNLATGEAGVPGDLYRYGTFGNGGADFNALAQLKVQAIGVVTVVAWSAIATIIIISICKVVTGLRVSEETEIMGLDEAEHGENAYNFD